MDTTHVFVAMSKRAPRRLTPVSINRVAALLAEQATIDDNDDGTPNTLDPFAIKAANDDVLHLVRC